MFLKQMKSKFFGLAMLAGLMTNAAKAENDLSQWTSVVLKADVYVGKDGSGANQLFFSIPNTYTNSLDCVVKAQVTLAGADGPVDRLATAKVVSVPKQAFGFEFTFKLPVSLGSEESIDESYTGKATATCKGLGGETSHPLCKNPKFYPNFTETCRKLPDQKVFPWVANGIWVGSCHCSEDDLS